MSAFTGCKSLISIDIHNVTSIASHAFTDCTSLTSVTMPNSVTTYCYIGDGAFLGCESLLSITIPNGLTTINGYVFESCKSLSDVTIPDSVTNIGPQAFQGCAKLTNVTIPNSVTSIDNWVFENCTSLTSVTIGNSVTSIGNSAFAGCTSLTEINVDSNNVKYSSQDGVLFNKDKTKLIQYPIGNARTSYSIPDSTTSIGSGAFDGCKSLTSVTIPDSVTSIDAGTFYGCTSLASITIPNGLTTINGYVFKSCKSLTSITIPNSVTSINYNAFYECGLTDIYYKGTKEQWKSINLVGNEDGSSLKTANIHCTDGGIFNGGTAVINGLRYQLNSDNTASVIGYEGNPTNVNIPGTISYANETLSITSIGGHAFSYCESLTSVTIPDSVTNIGSASFRECTSLTDVYYTATKEQWKSLSIESYDNYNLTSAVLHCTDGVTFNGGTVVIDDFKYKLNSTNTATLVGYTDIPDSITIPSTISYANETLPVTSIGDYAFEYCESLTSVTIPNSVTSIGYKAFYECTSLTDVYYTGKEGQWNSISIDEYNYCLRNATIHYTDVPSVDPTPTPTPEPTTQPSSTTTTTTTKPTTTKPSTSTTTTTTTTVATTESTTSATTQPTTEAPATQPTTVPATTAAPVVTTTQPATVATTTQATTQATTAATTTAVAVPTTAQTVVTTQKPTTTKAPEKINKKQKNTKVKKATPAKASATISWAKVKGVKGYEVQLATDKKFKKNVKSKTINKQKTTKTTVKNLKSKTKYYVRIRTYKMSKGTKVYSAWSKTKTVKTK